MEGRGTTRRAVALGLVASALPFPARASGCGAPTRRQTEGPYYTPSTPRRADLREPGSDGETLVLEGSVLTANCRPLPGAVIDIWHCDERGRYDNRGFRYRGHQVTDPAGMFRFLTIRPVRYTGRTPHIHVKLFGAGTHLLTTQVYFPDHAATNARDRIYRDDLLVRLDRDAGDEWRARFDFVLAPA
ncbi:MAG: intradiol ring-cleavage dioxygenase [Alphaproteobacteria bacterium]|nr:intradiol ring-cleavage dioxygenase [Alphaproteobacteria bacterium]